MTRKRVNQHLSRQQRRKSTAKGSCEQIHKFPGMFIECLKLVSKPLIVDSVRVPCVSGQCMVEFPFPLQYTCPVFCFCHHLMFLWPLTWNTVYFSSCRTEKKPWSLLVSCLQATGDKLQVQTAVRSNCLSWSTVQFAPSEKFPVCCCVLCGAFKNLLFSLLIKNQARFKWEIVADSSSAFVWEGKLNTKSTLESSGAERLLLKLRLHVHPFFYGISTGNRFYQSVLYVPQGMNMLFIGAVTQTLLSEIVKSTFSRTRVRAQVSVFLRRQF